MVNGANARAKLKRLKAAGWKVGTAKDFLGLSDQEAALVEVRLSLTDALKKSRQKRRLSQVDLAHRMGSSQSRIAKIEAGDSSVSLDLIVRALIAAGRGRPEARFVMARRACASPASEGGKIIEGFSSDRPPAKRPTDTCGIQAA